jgi:hypothetical protein
MGMSERFRNGVYMASNSFAMLWDHPGLLIYLGGAAFVYLLVQLLVYNIPMIGFAGDELTIFIGMQGLQYSLVEFSQWLYQGFFVLLTFMYVFAITFLHVCLIRHTLAIIYDDKDKAKILVVLRKSVISLGRITIWSILFTGISLVLRVIAFSTYSSKASFSLGLIVVIMVVASWALATFFVLPIIAVHTIGIWRALTTSFKMVTSLLVEIIGAQAWMALISLLTFIPLSIVLRVVGQSSGMGTLVISFGITLLTVFSAYIILSAQTVLKTKLYYYYVQPLEEMAFLRYPHF